MNDIMEIMSKSHAKLLRLKNAGALVPGQKYKITDFKTKYQQPVSLEIKTAPNYETLLLTAISRSEFDIMVQSVEFPRDIIEYDITNILCEDGTTARNGKITYRKDTVNNLSAYYDFRTVKFRRWKVDCTQWVTGTAYSERALVKDTVDNNIYCCINNLTSSTVAPSSDGQNWVSFADIVSEPFISWTNNKALFGLGGASTGNLIINNTTENVDYEDVFTFATGCVDIVIGINDTYNNIVFTGACHTIKIGAKCNTMTITDGSYNLSFDLSSNKILLGAGCNFIDFGQYSQMSSIGSQSNTLTLGMFFNYGILGSACGNIKTGADCGNLIMGNSCAWITLDCYCSNNSFGSSCTKINYLAYVKSCKIGSGSSELTFLAAVKGVKFLDATSLHCPAKRMIIESSDYTSLSTVLNGAKILLANVDQQKTLYKDKIEGFQLRYVDSKLLTFESVN